MRKRLTVHSYGDNTAVGGREAPDHVRVPLVHLLYSDDWHSAQSISFPPGQAPIIAAAILRAGVAAGKDVDDSHELKWEDDT